MLKGTSHSVSASITETLVYEGFDSFEYQRISRFPSAYCQVRDSNVPRLRR
jgi:hypothetical protein